MKISRLSSIVAMLTLCLSSLTLGTQAQQPVSQSTNPNETSRGWGDLQFTNLIAQARPNKRTPFFLTPESGYANAGVAASGIAPAATGPSLIVTGSGTLGRLTKWSGFTSSNAVIGDTTIYEDKFGKVGIGTDSPTSKLTVVGTIEATGGFKFPASAHDATLRGEGTTALPLGVAVPLELAGAVPVKSSTNAAVIKVTNTLVDGWAIHAEGGARSSSAGGVAVHAVGGMAGSGDGGVAVSAQGGVSNSGVGGSAYIGVGGHSDTNLGGPGALLAGGSSGINVAGDGVLAIGGHSLFSSGGFAGNGVFAVGGDSRSGGAGVNAKGGTGSEAAGGFGVVATGGTGNGTGFRGGAGIFASGGSGMNGATAGLAGHFNGDVQVSGSLFKGGGAFKIDHPLDPANKYLSHSFVESPDMMNIYNGNITTDANGDAVVTLPDYFDALNKEFRYQLTVIGTFAQAIVAEEVRGNRFAIRTNAPNVRVSWQVTGIRHDAFANKNRIQVEEAKTEVERGYYLHPEAFDQPEEKSINWAHDREGMMRLKQQRIEAEKTREQKRNDR